MQLIFAVEGHLKFTEWRELVNKKKKKMARISFTVLISKRIKKKMSVFLTSFPFNEYKPEFLKINTFFFFSLSF